MPDVEQEMTWEEKVDHAAVALVVPAVVVWAAVVLATRPETGGRQAGAVLELLGFGMAAYGLQEKVAQVTGRPGLSERLVEWFRRGWRQTKMAFGWKPKGQTVALEAAGVAVAAGDVRVKVTPAPDATLDHRVDLLEQRVETLEARIDEVERKAREARDELSEEIADLRSELHEVEAELEDLVRRLAIGSLHREATGLFWFAVGVVVATWPGVIPGV